MERWMRGGQGGKGKSALLSTFHPGKSAPVFSPSAHWEEVTLPVTESATLHDNGCQSHSSPALSTSVTSRLKWEECPFRDGFLRAGDQVLHPSCGCGFLWVEMPRSRGKTQSESRISSLPQWRQREEAPNPDSTACGLPCSPTVEDCPSRGSSTTPEEGRVLGNVGTDCRNGKSPGGWPEV